MKNSMVVGAIKQRQKYISIGLIGWILKYKKHLQRQENIRHGRKAKTISFVFATKNPTSLAKFILEGRKK